MTDLQSLSSKAIAYWVDRWDRECPTLFGRSLEDFEALLRSVQDMTPEHTRAAHQALNELLNGASSVRATELPTILGVDEAVARAIMIELGRRLQTQR